MAYLMVVEAEGLMPTPMAGESTKELAEFVSKHRVDMKIKSYSMWRQEGVQLTFAGRCIWP